MVQVYQFSQECRTNLETLQLKEKALEKAFRKDYLEASKVVQEATLKLYRYKIANKMH